ncbi:YbaN family protein [Amphritea pacifica]|uniref:Inner membrane protein n=1 Tax=Amphritea pacifica TaxID=2811233 RepID=A0ABS2W7C7_9GAMM|nr:YbaN family protein [Amphritea pacifica]MBN1007450.1 YbaN family protein [Amphritea pacifica]
MRQTLIRTLFLLSGFFFVLLGIIGLLLPLVPTTPFLLVAAFCFSRSSERLHQYLLNHRWFGHYIRDWEEHGVIPLKAKLFASGMMLIMISYPLLFLSFHPGLKAVAAATVILALWYVWRKPSKRPLSADTTSEQSLK